MTPEALLQSATQIYVQMPCTPQVAVDRAQELADLVTQPRLPVVLEPASGVDDSDPGDCA